MKRFSVYIYSLIIVALVMTVFSSCKKDKCKAGTGGGLTLKFNTMHHLKYVYGLTVKIKFDTQDFPGENAAYDLTTQAGAHDSSVTFTGLKCGDYYIYGVGTDSTLTSTNKIVKGGFPYSTTKENVTIELTLPVSE